MQRESKYWSADFVSEQLGSEELSKGKLIEFLQHNATAEFLQSYSLCGESKEIKKSLNRSQLIQTYKVNMFTFSSVFFSDNAISKDL